MTPTTAKANLMAALTELTQIHSQAAVAHSKASLAAGELATVLASTTDPNELARLLAGLDLSESPTSGKKKKKKPKKAEDPNAPKRPQGAYFEYQNSPAGVAKVRAEDASLSYKEGVKKHWLNIKSENDAIYGKQKEAYEQKKAAGEDVDSDDSDAPQGELASALKKKTVVPQSNVSKGKEKEKQNAGPKPPTPGAKNSSKSAKPSLPKSGRVPPPTDHDTSDSDDIYEDAKKNSDRLREHKPPQASTSNRHGPAGTEDIDSEADDDEPVKIESDSDEDAIKSRRVLVEGQTCGTPQ